MTKSKLVELVVRPFYPVILLPSVLYCLLCISNKLNPLPDDKILDRSNWKQSADDNCKFDENSRKFSKQVENTVGKGEIARYEQFLFFPQCFQKACFVGASKGVIVWEWVNTCVNIHILNLIQLSNRWFAKWDSKMKIAQ